MKFRFYIENILSVQNLIDEPIAWKEAAFTFFRDTELHGIFPMYNNTMKFYGTAYNLIAAEYADNGVEGFLRLIIQFECANDTYEELHVSKLNFSKIQFENSTVCLVSLPIEDDTCYSQLKSRSDQEVNIELNTSLDGEPLTDYFLPMEMMLAPKTFILSSRFDEDFDNYLEWDETISISPGVGASLEGISTKFIQLGFHQIISDDAGISDNTFAAYDNLSDIQPIFTAGRTGAYSLDINVSLEAFFGGSGTDLIMVSSGNPAGIDSYSVEVFIQFNAGVPFSLGGFTVLGDGTGWPPKTLCIPPDSTNYIQLNSNYTASNLLTAGDTIKLYATVFFGTLQLNNTAGSDRNYELCARFTMLESVDPGSLNYFHADLATDNGETQCEVALVNEALSRTVESITNDCLRVKSNYFGRTDSQPYASAGDGYGALEVLTNGLKIRRLHPISGVSSPLMFSFKDMWDGLNPIHSLGMGLEPDAVRGGNFQWLRIERAQYFYDDTVVLTCDKVPDITIRVISEEHYSIFQFGYQKWEAEQYNGLDEFATKRSYRTSLQNVKNTLTQISKFIASGYAVEITKGVGRTTKDWRFDNDQFIICVERGGAGYYGYGEDFEFIVEQGNITSPANLIDPPTVYNFRISPLRNLLRWAWKLFASYNNPWISELIFMSGEGNILAEGKMDNGAEVWEANVLSESEPFITLSEDIEFNGSVSTFEFPEDGMPIYRLEEWQFEYPMSVQDYHAVKANPRGLISVRYGQNSTFDDCYIRRIEWKVAKQRAVLTLLPLSCKQAKTTIILIDIPADGDTFTIDFPETTELAAWSVTWTFVNTPALPTDIQIFPGDLDTQGVAFNSAVRLYLQTGSLPAPNAVQLRYSQTALGGDNVTQRFYATPKKAYDGDGGNYVQLTWSNGAVFAETSGLFLTGGTGSCNIATASLIYYMLQENGDFLLQENGDQIIL